LRVACESVDVDGWEGWYFEHGMLCSPNGDRFTPLCIMACFFVRQMDSFREVLRTDPVEASKRPLLVRDLGPVSWVVDSVQAPSGQQVTVQVQ